MPKLIEYFPLSLLAWRYRRRAGSASNESAKSIMFKTGLDNVVQHESQSDQRQCNPIDRNPRQVFGQEFVAQIGLKANLHDIRRYGRQSRHHCLEECLRFADKRRAEPNRRESADGGHRYDAPQEADQENDFEFAPILVVSVAQ